MSTLNWGVKMKSKIKIIILVFVLLLVGVACAIPKTTYEKWFNNNSKEELTLK